MSKSLYVALKEVCLFSAWHLQPESYKEDRITIQFVLCFKSLKIEVILNKEDIDLDIKRMLKSIKERAL